MLLSMEHHFYRLFKALLEVSTPFQEEAMSLLLPLKYRNLVMPSEGGHGSSLPRLAFSMLRPRPLSLLRLF